MRIAIAIFLVVIFGSACAMEPDQAFDNLIDAMYQKDAEVLMSYLSTESLGLIDFLLVTLKEEPAENIAEYAEDLDLKLTVEEIGDWASVDFVEEFITAQVFINELPPREDLLSSGFEVHGDSSIVFVNYDSLAPRRILMVKEEGNWKLDQRVIGSFMI
ncbi:MAG: hypothetical protein KAH31_03930 [Candidatus Sabulitectum sp.]|nr:hypothetical protein [Candidatus Sabulitectum sp.]